MNLTNKQEKFVLALIDGKSQREAYRLAYNSKNMSDTSVDVNACKLLKNAKVALRLEELRSRLVKEAEDEAIIDAKEVLREIASIARDDISNYLDFYPGNTLGGIKIDIKDSRQISTRNVSEVSIGANGQFKFKLYCRDTALYKLADILGLSKEATAHSGGDAANIVDAIDGKAPILFADEAEPVDEDEGD